MHSEPSLQMGLVMDIMPDSQCICLDGKSVTGKESIV